MFWRSFHIQIIDSVFLVKGWDFIIVKDANLWTELSHTKMRANRRCADVQRIEILWENFGIVQGEKGKKIDEKG